MDPMCPAERPLRPLRTLMRLFGKVNNPPSKTAADVSD